MELPTRCPVCDTPLEEDEDAGFKIPPECPYLDTAYPELCALHDKVYFGRWRKMEADQNDVRRGYRKLGRLLVMMKDAIRRENVELARQHIRKAEEAFAMSNAEGEPYSSVKFMDQSLSYIHHALNDLLRKKRAKLHSPADYEKHYDVILPFKDDW
ncbi:MAG TPA: hypothetical protein VFU42_10395 [Candidatus Deferrimicrobiaceae bacterium]|nr:hypothetical protein [Candidatus Deferrimicrobiaceae bacterium]